MKKKAKKGKKVHRAKARVVPEGREAIGRMKGKAALAGAVGTLCRFFCLKLVAGCAACLPLGTLVVNGVGAFLAGLLFAVVRNKLQILEPWVPVLMIGFLGAFTTFSTLMLETMNLALAGSWGKATWNLLGQNVFGLLAVLGGIAVGRIL